MDKNHIVPKKLAEELMPEWAKQFKESPEKLIEKWLEWPPDIFALTTMLLKRTGIYRYVVTPHRGRAPYQRLLSNLTRKQRAEEPDEQATEWLNWIIGIRPQPPALLIKWMKTIFKDQCKLTLEPSPPDYQTCEDLLRLHTLADAACAGLGMMTGSYSDRMCAVQFLANYLLTVTGSLSRLPSRHGVVLPKMRTPQGGLTIRSFSHHLTFHRSEVDVLWQSIPWNNFQERENTLNILAIPFPLKIDYQAFRPVAYSGQNKDVDQFRYFDYAPTEEFEPGKVIRLLAAANKKVEQVDIIVFPESALTEEDLEKLQGALQSSHCQDQIPMIITGIRAKGDWEEGQNKVRLSVHFAGKWYNLGQDKHHRWKLDKSQLEQYSLRRSLSPQHQWWEAIDIPPRKLTFMVPNTWLTLCPLICEDLAQLEPISDLIRGVGPNLVIAILLDGPQLPHRWPARYVGVLADDPGSSVLTLTSLGMALRSKVQGHAPSRAIALWKGSNSGWESIDLANDSEAVLLSIWADFKEEFTADGRSDGGVTAALRLEEVHQLRGDEQLRLSPPKAVLKSRPLDLKELTAFSFLADAIIDAPSHLIHEFRLKVERSHGPFPLVDGIKPFSGIWRQIENALEKEKALAKKKEKVPKKSASTGKAPSWLRAFDDTVGQLCRFMIVRNKELNDWLLSPADTQEEAEQKIEQATKYDNNLKRWDSLVDDALVQLAKLEVDSLALADDDVHKEKFRLDRVIYISVIWAIYNRLLLAKRDIDPTHSQFKEDPFFDYQKLLRPYKDLSLKIERWVTRNNWSAPEG